MSDARGPDAANDLLRERAWTIAARVEDPELPMLTAGDLGVLRDVRIVDGVVEVTMTPTRPGCPAMSLIALNIETVLEDAGFGLARMVTSLSPAWTPDWISEAGMAKLAAYGIAPAQLASPRSGWVGETVRGAQVVPRRRSK